MCGGVRVQGEDVGVGEVTFILELMRACSMRSSSSEVRELAMAKAWAASRGLASSTA